MSSDSSDYSDDYDSDNLDVIDRETPASKQGPNFFLLRNFKQTVAVDYHIAALPLAPSSTGDNPVCSIQFKNLNLSDIEEIFNGEVELKKGNLFPLRNFLIGKKRGNDSCKRVFQLIAKTDKSKISYCVQIDKDFVSKTCKTLRLSKIQIDLKIEGINRFSPGSRSEWTRYKTDSNGVNLIDLQSATSQSIDLILTSASSSTFYGNGITKKSLEKQSSSVFKNIVFLWTVSIGFEDEPPLIQGGCFRQNWASTLESLYNLDDSTKDVTIVANNKAEIKCHRVILMANIPLFRSMLNPQNRMMEGETGRIEMLENSADGLNQFIRFLYGFSVKPERLTPDLAVELLQLSNKYGLDRLERNLTEFLTSKTVEWFTVDALMELYFIVKNVESLEEVRAHALTEMSGLTRETLSGCEYFKKLPQQDAMAFLFSLMEWR